MRDYVGVNDYLCSKYKKLKVGGALNIHRHDVPLFAMMLAGEVTLEDGNGVTRSFMKADTFHEACQTSHAGTDEGTHPVRILVVFAGSDSVRNTIMVPKIASTAVYVCCQILVIGPIYRQFVQGRRMNPKNIHFLHISKTAGTQMGALCRQINSHGGYRVQKHLHYVKLGNIPDGEDFFFSIRSPETRFVSGFYSRKRKGQPRFNREWTAFEREAFGDFEHANDLAEALFEPGHAGLRALCAVTSILHCAEDQVNWFLHVGYFLRVRVPLMIVRQEHFTSDVKFLFQLLGIESDPIIDDSPVGRHANNYADVPALSPKAIENIRRWYAQDFEFYGKLQYWLANQFPGKLEGLP